MACPLRPLMQLTPPALDSSRFRRVRSRVRLWIKSQIIGRISGSIRHGVPIVYLAIFVLPLLAGLWQLLVAGISAPHIALLLAQPGLWHSAWLSLWIGAASTLGSVLFMALLLAHSDSRAM
ncbi:MAG: hypothetical protein ACRDDA_12270, partial [Aeromonas sp.]